MNKLTRNTTLKICRTHLRKLTLQQSASLDFRGFTFFFFAKRALASFFPSAIVVGSVRVQCNHLPLDMLYILMDFLVLKIERNIV